MKILMKLYQIAKSPLFRGDFFMFSSTEALRRSSGRDDGTSWQYYGNNDEPSKKDPRIKKSHQRRAVASEWLFNEAARAQEYDDDGFLRVHRVCNCGKAAYGKDGASLKSGEHGVTHHNIAYCGGVNHCPVCSGLILKRRAAEIDEGLGTHLRRGGGVLMLTLTVSHAKKDRLEDQIKLVQGAYSYLIRDRWHGIAERYGFIRGGYIKRKETTRGDTNGWHHHYHVLLLTDCKLNEAQAASLEEELFAYWEKGVTRRGGKVDRLHGIDVGIARSIEQIGNYISKELTSNGDTKTKGGSLNPFQLLDEDTTENRRLWSEYVKATAGMHVIQWGRGLKELLGIADRSDMEILDDESAGRGKETLGKIEASLYNARRRDLTLMRQVDDAVSAGDYEHAAALLGCSFYFTDIIENGKAKAIPYFLRE